MGAVVLLGGATLIGIVNSYSNSQLAAPQPEGVNHGLRDVQMARVICDNLDAAGAGTGPCEVGTFSITIHSNNTVAEAEALCHAAVSTLKQQKVFFSDKWTLYFKSPYSGGESIAYCQLPSDASLT